MKRKANLANQTPLPYVKAKLLCKAQKNELAKPAAAVDKNNRSKSKNYKSINTTYFRQLIR